MKVGLGLAKLSWSYAPKQQQCKVSNKEAGWGGGQGTTSRTSTKETGVHVPWETIMNRDFFPLTKTSVESSILTSATPNRPQRICCPVRTNSKYCE